MPRPPAPGSQRGSPRPARASGWRASPVRLRIAPPAPCAWNCVTAAHRRSRSPPPLAAAPPRHRRPGLPPPLVAPARLIAYLLPSSPSPSEPCPLPLLPPALPPLQAPPPPLLPSPPSAPSPSLPAIHSAGGGQAAHIGGGYPGEGGAAGGAGVGLRPAPLRLPRAPAPHTLPLELRPHWHNGATPPPPPAPPPFLHRPHRYQRQPTPWPQLPTCGS